MPLQTFQGSSKSQTSNTLCFHEDQKIVRFSWFENMSRFQPPFFFQDSENLTASSIHHRWLLPQAPRFEEAVVHRLQKSRNEGLAGIDWSFLQVSCLRELWWVVGGWAKVVWMVGWRSTVFCVGFLCFCVCREMCPVLVSETSRVSQRDGIMVIDSKKTILTPRLACCFGNMFIRNFTSLTCRGQKNKFWDGNPFLHKKYHLFFFGMQELMSKPSQSGFWRLTMVAHGCRFFGGNFWWYG